MAPRKKTDDAKVTTNKKTVRKAPVRKTRAAANGESAPTGGGNLYIMKGIPADHQAAAWKLIQWLSSPEQEAQWSIDSGYVAPRKSAYEPISGRASSA